MQRSALRFSRSKLLCSLPAVVALPALAGTPQVLDHVPADTQAVVVMPDLGEFLNDLNAANAVLGENGEPMLNMMTAMVRGMPGLNVGGSMAVALHMENPQDDPDFVLLVPVSDYAAFTNEQEGEGGLHRMPLGDQMMYLRDLGGGYAAMGPIAEDVRAFDGTSGNLKTHAKALGRAGSRIADQNDVFVFVSIPQFREQIDMGLAEMEMQSEMIEVMSGPEAAQGFDAMLGMVEGLTNDATAFSAGLSFDAEAGVIFDFGLQFREGSEWAGYFENNGDASKYFSMVPNMDYFFAASYDMSGDGVQRLMGEYLGFIEQMDTTGAMGGLDLKAMMAGTKGGVQVMGASDNIMGGLFNNTLYYAEVANPEAFIDSTREMYADMNEEMGQLAEMGMAMSATVSETPASIDGVEAYPYSMSMSMEGMMDGGMGMMDPSMIMQMMFGGEGPSGYMAPAGDHGLVMTMSQDPGMLKRAIAATKGEDTMGSVKAMATTRAMLPDNRVMEMYIGADHLANTAGPLAMMFGLIPEFEPIQSLPPLGMGLTADGGGMLFRTAIPMQTIKTSLSIIEEMENMQDDGMGEMEF